MSTHPSLERRRIFGDLTQPGRAWYDFAACFAAISLLIPLVGLLGIVFADQSRRRGYRRWKAVLAATIWCMVVGLVIQGVLRTAVYR